MFAWTMGWTKKVVNRENALEMIIKVQRNGLIGLFILCLILIIAYFNASKEVTIHIPPDIQNGATMKISAIPNSFIYSFSYSVWQEINCWQKEGGEDYANNIHNNWAYLTPQFKAELLQEAEELKQSGQSQRMRFMQGKEGAAFEEGAIKKLAQDTWEVDLVMRLKEFRNNQLVKDVEILYPLKVTRSDFSMRNNPYGLVMSGFVSEPRRIATYI